MVDRRREAGGVPHRPPAGTRRIVAELGRLGPVLPGTLTQRYTRCGREGCRCMADPPKLHGPYWSWTRKVANKTVTRYLSAEEYAKVGTWFDNAKRARQLLTELEALALTAMGEEPPGPDKRRRRSS